MGESRDIGAELFRALLSVDRLAANRLLSEEASDLTPAKRVEQLIAPALNRMGKEWEKGKVSLSQMYMGALICEDILGTIFPAGSSHNKEHPQMAIVTLEDHHLLGKKVVSSLLRSAGFELIDYGQGVTVDALFPKLKHDGIRILLISTLMLRSALRVRDLIDRIHEEGLEIKVVVGGAPFLFDDSLWKDVGADAMAPAATGVATILDKMAGEIK